MPEPAGPTGTLAMARYLTDPQIEADIQALAAAPAMTEDQRARQSRLLRLDPRRSHPGRPGG